MTRRLFCAFAAAGLFFASVAPASAHASHVSHRETCDGGRTTTVVTFDNDFSKPADVGYRWGSEPAGSAHMAAKTGGTNSTVSIPSHDVGTLAWHVTWSDGFRQPGSGETSLTVTPLANCRPATTTTSTAPAATTTTTERPACPCPTTTTSTGPSETTTTQPHLVILPPDAPPPTPTTAPPAAVEPATTTTTRAAAVVDAATETHPPRRLPRTGRSGRGLVVGGLLTLLGGLFVAAGRTNRRTG